MGTERTCVVAGGWGWVNGYKVSFRVMGMFWNSVMEEWNNDVCTALDILRTTELGEFHGM